MSTLPEASSWGGISDQMSTWPEVVSHLTTRCLCQGVCLTRSQPGPKSDQMSTRPEASSWGAVCLTQGKPDQKSDQMSNLPEASSWGGTSDKGQPDPKIWQKCQPDVKPHLQGVYLTKCRKVIWKFENTLHFLSCFTEAFSMKDQLLSL